MTYIIQLIFVQLNLYKPGSFAGIRTYPFILKHVAPYVKEFLKYKCKELLIFLFVFCQIACGLFTLALQKGAVGYLCRLGLHVTLEIYKPHGG